MRIRNLLAASLLAATSLSSSAFSQANQTKPATQPPQVLAHPPVDPTDKVYPLDQIIPATVHDAWLLSGRNEEAFFDIVEQLAQFSAQKRGVTLPDNAAAGKRMGLMIKTKAEADRNQLLYVIVDQAVRAVGTKPTTTASK
jgi:hypothetical protein